MHRPQPGQQDGQSDLDAEPSSAVQTELDVAAAIHGLPAAPVIGGAALEAQLQSIKNQAARRRQGARGRFEGIANLFVGPARASSTSAARVPWTPGSPARKLGWRVAPVVMVSLLLGGVATAIAGRVLTAWRSEATTRAAPALPAPGLPATAPHRTRHLKIRVDQPARMDISLDQDEPDVSVQAGSVAIVEQEGARGEVTVREGESWRSVQEAAAKRPSPASQPPAALGKATTADAPNAERPGRNKNKGTVLGNGPLAPPKDVTAQHPLWRALAMLSPSDMKPAGASDAPSLVPPPFFPAVVPSDTATHLTRRSVHRLDTTPTTRGAPPAPTIEPPGEEARLLGEGLRRLRTDHDPDRAIEVLNERDRRFPRGAFERQAGLVRVEALLNLGRQNAAMQVLDTFQLEATPADRAPTLARAELRAANGRCIDAISDFDRVLKVSPSEAVPVDVPAERALYGRAVCRARGGDLGGARVDLRTYLEQFPHSPRRAEAERTLRGLGG